MEPATKPRSPAGMAPDDSISTPVNVAIYVAISVPNRAGTRRSVPLVLEHTCCFTLRSWRARRDSNPRPSDPKLSSRQGEQSESIRAWNGHRDDAVFVDSGVSLDPTPERVLVPS